MIKVSIIIPVYNVNKYIEDSMISISLQNFNDFEVILVDDESPDDSIEIAEQVLKKYRVEYKVIHQNNTGLPGARNTGFKYAQGEYVTFIDSDDCISNEHIRKMYNLAKDRDLMVVHSLFEYTTPSNKMGSFISPESDTLILGQETLFNSFKKRKPSIHCCTLLVNREFLIEHSLKFNEKLRYGEDAEFMIRLFYYVDRIGVVNEKSYKYLIRSNSIMGSISHTKGIDFYKEYKSTCTELANNNLGLKKEITQIFWRNILGLLHAYSKCSTICEFKNFYKEIEGKELFCSLFLFPDLRVIILNLVIRVSPNLFYFIFMKKK